MTIEEQDVLDLEKVIDEYTVKLPPVKSFILPGSSLAGAQLHVCRTVCRRAERRFVQFASETTVRPVLENTLIDYLISFIFSPIRRLRRLSSQGDGGSN